MNYEELTPGLRNGYDGYMSTVGEGSQEGQPTGEHRAGPPPITSGETDRPPEGAETSAERWVGQKREAEPARSLTRDELVRVAQTVQGKPNAGDVLIDAQFVSTAALVLYRNLEHDADKYKKNIELFEEFKSKNLLDAAQKLRDFITNSKANGLTVEDEDSASRRATIRGQAGNIAELAKAVANYYSKAEISKERDDPFRQIVSFEELMTKFNITLEDDRFRPGGEFALLDIHKYEDRWGREMSEEKAHPENFYRWVLERAYFYHDFDPMSNIDLFQGMYLIAGSRKVSMYEMLVDFNAYFAHRVPTTGDLYVTMDDIDRSKNALTLVKPEEDMTEEEEKKEEERKDNPAVIEERKKRQEQKQVVQELKAWGKYMKDQTGKPLTIIYEGYIDPETNEEALAIANPTDQVNSRGERVYRVEYLHIYKDADGKEQAEWKPVQAQKENKEEWDTIGATESGPGSDVAKEFDNAKTEIMYQLWLMTKNHNMDVTYRQKGMMSEAPLKETLSELYADNLWTRTRRRLLGIMDMPATTLREIEIPAHEDKDGQMIPVQYIMVSEATQQWRKELKHQGTLGKAFQRALAAFYHISEANAAFNGYKIEGENPFFEMLQKGNIKGADIFYKALIRRTLFEDKKFGYVDKDDPSKTRIEVEFFNALNETRVPRANGTDRQRFAWEKADFVDFMTLSRTDFLQAMKDRKITTKTLDEVFDTLRKKYTEKGNEARVIELGKLRKRFENQSADRKTAFLDSLKSVKAIGEDAFKRKGELDSNGKELESDGFIYKYIHNGYGSDPLTNLSGFAVALFTKGFPIEATPDINPYSNIRYSLEARDRMRSAMRDVLTYTEQLDDFDAKWAEEWAFTFTYHTGISARNDMQGIGHDAWSKVQNTEFYRLRQTGGGNYPGNLDNLYGIHRLGTDFWQGLKVQRDGRSGYDATIYEILTGLEPVTEERNGKKVILGYKFNVNKDVGSFEFAGNAMRQFIGDHVGHAIDLFVDITQKHEFNLDKLIKMDNWGRLIVSHEEMQKMIDSTWKHLRYGFDNNGFLYDNMQYGWLYDETMGHDGSISRKPHFGFATLRQLMFSDKVRNMHMYEREDVSSFNTIGKEGPGKAGKMGRNVFAYLIAAQLREHTRYDSEGRIYSAEEVQLITEAFMHYAARVMQGEPGEALVLSGFFSPEEILKILTTAHALLWALYMKEYGVSMSGGFLFGFLEAFALIMKQAGEGIRL